MIHDDEEASTEQIPSQLGMSVVTRQRQGAGAAVCLSVNVTPTLNQRSCHRQISCKQSNYMCALLEMIRTCTIEYSTLNNNVILQLAQWIKTKHSVR